MTPGEFIAKWRASELKERSASQSHFIDLCRMLGEPTPTDADPARIRLNENVSALEPSIVGKSRAGKLARKPGNQRLAARQLDRAGQALGGHLRSCIGILRLAKTYGSERLEAACERALEIDATSYSSVASILKNKLERRAALSDELDRI